MPTIAVRSIVGAVILGVIAACAESAITGVPDTNVSAFSAKSGAETVGTSLVECPIGETTSRTAVITPLGGSVSAGGTTVVIPAGAVLLPTTITVTVPASRYLEVDISAAGVEHFVFELPVVVTLSYARCNRANIDKAPLSVWYIDSNSKDLLELMGGFDNKLTREVTFLTGHLSGYAIAN